MKRTFVQKLKMDKKKFRKRKFINYYEPDEPPFDEYIYCDHCYDFVYEYCAIHGPLLVVPDNKVTSKAGIPSWVPRAALTTPTPFLHIAPSEIPGAGLGVFSSLTLPRGVRFGPYCGKRTDDVNSMYCWQIRTQNSYSVMDGTDGEASNWMRYVNCARHWHEQNLVAFQYQGQIFYRTVKIIPKFTELLVFYGGQFAHALGIDLKNYNNPRTITVGKYIIEDSPKQVEVHNPQPVYNTEVLEIHEETSKDKQGTEETILNAQVAITEYNKSLDPSLKKDNKLICDVCNKFVERKNVTRHKRIHEQNYLFCPECSYKTNFSDRLKLHMKSHTKDEIYECDKCTYVAYNKKYFRRHYKIIHKEILTATDDLYRYNKILEKTSFYNCPKCEFKTNFNETFITHLNGHKSNSYQCDLCSYSSIVRQNFVKHIRTHKQFNSSTGELDKHKNWLTHKRMGHEKLQETVKNTSDVYRCEFCTYTGVKRSYLLKHMRRCKIN